MYLRRQATGPKGGPIASRSGSVPDFFRKPRVTCDFPGKGICSKPLVPPLDPPMIVSVINIILSDHSYTRVPPYIHLNIINMNTMLNWFPHHDYSTKK